MEYLALHVRFDSNTALTLGMCSRDERLRSTRCARQRQAAADDASSHLSVETSLKPRSIPHYTLIAVPEARAQPGVSELLKQMQLAGRVRDMDPLSLREAAMRFGINNLPAIFCQQIVAIWGPHLTELILGPDETFVDQVRIESTTAWPTSTSHFKD